MELNSEDVLTEGLTPITGAITAGAAVAFWRWYEANRDRVIIRRSIFRPLGITLTVKVRDLRPVFVRIFGEPGA